MSNQCPYISITKTQNKYLGSVVRQAPADNKKQESHSPNYKKHGDQRTSKKRQNWKRYVCAATWSRMLERPEERQSLTISPSNILQVIQDILARKNIKRRPTGWSSDNSRSSHNTDQTKKVEIVGARHLEGQREPKTGWPKETWRTTMESEAKEIISKINTDRKRWKTLKSALCATLTRRRSNKKVCDAEQAKYIGW